MFYTSLCEAARANLNKTIEGRFYLFCKSVCERQSLKGRFSVGVEYKFEEDEKLIDFALIVKLLEQEEIEVSYLRVKDGYLCCHLDWFNSTKKNLIYKKGRYDYV
jgi:hypothetical protein